MPWHFAASSASVFWACVGQTLAVLDIAETALCSATQPVEIYVDDEAKLTLHGLVQHYIMLNEEEKNRKLNDLLDALDFNQVKQGFCSPVIFERCPGHAELKRSWTMRDWAC